MMEKIEAGEKNRSKAQKEKEDKDKACKAEILEIVKDRKLTISGIAEELEKKGYELTNQRISALVTQLVEEGLLIRTVESRKAYFQKS